MTAMTVPGVPSDDISIVTNKANGVDVEGQGRRRKAARGLL